MGRKSALVRFGTDRLGTRRPEQVRAPAWRRTVATSVAIQGADNHDTGEDRRRTNDRTGAKPIDLARLELHQVRAGDRDTLMKRLERASHLARNDRRHFDEHSIRDGVDQRPCDNTCIRNVKQRGQTICRWRRDACSHARARANRGNLDWHIRIAGSKQRQQPTNTQAAQRSHERIPPFESHTPPVSVARSRPSSPLGSRRDRRATDNPSRASVEASTASRPAARHTLRPAAAPA
jgi:hypothetical protein